MCGHADPLTKLTRVDMRRLARLSAYARWGRRAIAGPDIHAHLPPTVSAERVGGSESNAACGTRPVVIQTPRGKGDADGQKAGSATRRVYTFHSSLSSPVAMLKRQADKVI